MVVGAPRLAGLEGMTQLALQVSLDDHALFSSFFAGANEELLSRLREIALGRSKETALWMWGNPSTGKSHLLQAVCAHAHESGRRPLYLPLDRVMSLGPHALEGLERCDIACVDDVQMAAGKADWETAIFGLYNRAFEAGSTLVVAADSSPAGAGFALPDLRSRLASGLVYQLRPLNEQNRLDALRLRADRRGLSLPEETAAFLMKRHPRDLRSLFELLDSLDQASLAAQRRLTIPFVKDVLRAGE